MKLNQRTLGRKAPVRSVYTTVRVRTLVVMDQQKVRDDAARACRRELALLEKAEAELQRFESADREPFSRWMSATFGPMLTNLRELTARIAKQNSIVAEVEEEMFWTGERSERAAFLRVRMRAENPDLVAAVERQESSAASPPPLASDRMRTAVPQNPDEARIKDVYRLLVRRLHPDMRPKDAPDVSALWHEVQEAYADSNLERLETLAGFSDMRFASAAPDSSVSQMRRILRNIRSAFNDVQRKLRAAREDAAWNFSKLHDRADLERRMQKQLDADIARQTERLSSLDARIASWTSTKPKAKKPQPKVQPAQAEFW